MVDVNGTHFHLLTGPRDWRRPLAAGGPSLHFDREQGGVTLAPRLFRFPPRPAADAPDRSARRGAALDRYGNLFVIGADQRSIEIHPAGLDESGCYWPPAAESPTAKSGDAFAPVAPAPPTPPPLLRGLTVTSLNYCVVGTFDPAGLLIFDLHGGGPPEQVPWPADVPFAPFDMFPAADGGFWVLDLGPAEGAVRWWRFDRWRQPAGGTPAVLAAADVDDFKPVGGDPAAHPAVAFPTGYDVAVAAPMFDPLALVGLADETVLILGHQTADPVPSILRFDEEILLSEVPLDGSVLEGLLPPDAGLSAYDMTLHPSPNEADGTLTGVLRLIAGDGNQAFDLAYTAEPVAEGGQLGLALLPCYYPVRGFSGRGLVEAGAETLYDLGPRYVPLVAQPRARYAEDGAVEGLYFDGGKPDLVWHRVVLDACVPDDAAIAIEARAADDKADLELEDWEPQPAPHLRRDGADLPFHVPFPERAGKRGAGVWELLLQNQSGRWLELRMTLQGNGRGSPLVRALRVWRPRFSYLDAYLPAVYREDPVSADFLDRWLANFEGLFTGMEGRVAAAERFFDTRTAPDDTLDWLGEWLGADVGRLTDPERKRLMIAHAPLLWSWRGTPLGLVTLLRLVLDECVDETLFEPLRTGRLPEADPTAPRLIEAYRARDFSPVALGDPGTLDRPALVRIDTAYDASRGPEPLHRAYRTFLRARYGAEGDEVAALTALETAWNRSTGSFAAITFPPLTPADPDEAADWTDAGRFALGFVYPTLGLSDRGPWRRFISERYREIGKLNAAWGLTGGDRHAGFDSIALPDALPASRRRLADWLDFATHATPIRRAAHRFSVLLPTEPGEDEASRTARADRARAVIERERPAHTDFDVRFFWSLLQVGSARLGTDTVVGEGARFAAVVLGQTALGAGYLSLSHPWSVRERAVVDRFTVLEA